MNPFMPTLLSIDTPGDKRSLPVKNQFHEGLMRKRSKASDEEEV